MSEWRYIAQRALTGEFLDWELPLQRDELSWALSGAGSLRGRLAPDIGGLRAADGRLVLEEWGTYIYAESGGQIRWGGIVISSRFKGEEWEVEAAGFTTYPNGMPYTGSYSRVGVDPATVIADIWGHLQSQPDGDLGVTVVGTSTPTRLGTTAEPYALQWFDAPDCGQEIDSLVSEANIEYVERHSWASASSEVINHEVILAYPRVGRRRDDLAFVQGDNVIEVVEAERPGDEFANAVVGIGAGEGKKEVYRQTGVRDGRLRRARVYTDKSVTSTSRMDSRIARELSRRRALLEIDEVVVRDHPNAPIGSWALGDDIEVRASLPWLGEVALWCRVVEWALVTDDVARLVLKRSDSFTYGG